MSNGNELFGIALENLKREVSKIVGIVDTIYEEVKANRTPILSEESLTVIAKMIEQRD